MNNLFFLIFGYIIGSISMMVVLCLLQIKNINEYESILNKKNEK